MTRRSLTAGSIAACVVTVLLAAMSGCKRSHATSGASESPSVTAEGTSTAAAPAVPFEVRRESTDLTFFWFDEHGTAHAASHIEEIPAPNRQVVRVDPAQPEQRTPGWVYIADLRAPRPDGRFNVRAIQSEQFANDLSARNGLAQAMAAPAPAMPQAPAAPPQSILAPRVPPPPSSANAHGSHAGQVVIYGASWCSACHQAAAWMRAQGIPFIEHDIETEPDAAQEMYARARQQGVPTGSIPIIDINGRLMVGFNPGAIQQALRGS